MRADEIRELGAEDMSARIQELEEERFRLRFRSATEPLEDPLRLRVIRRDIARLKTILHEQVTGIVRTTSGADEKTKVASSRKKEAGKKSRRPAKKGATKTRAR